MFTVVITLYLPFNSEYSIKKCRIEGISLCCGIIKFRLWVSLKVNVRYLNVFMQEHCRAFLKAFW